MLDFTRTVDSRGRAALAISSHVAKEGYKSSKVKTSPHHPRWGMTCRDDVDFMGSFDALLECKNRLYQSTPHDCIKQKLLLGMVSKIIKGNLSLSCMHIKGHGGRKRAALHVQENLQMYHYIYKSDILSYYNSIDHSLLMNELSDLIPSKSLLNGIHKAIHRDVDHGGYYTKLQGLPMGSSLSPLLGAVYLKKLDQAMDRRQNIFYRRYMDDFIIMTKTKSEFKSAIKQIKQILKYLKVKEHPDKTHYLRTHDVAYDTIGEEKQTLDYLRRVVNTPDVGFDFLGYHISQSGIRLKRATAQKMIATKTKVPKKKWFKPGSIQEEIYGPYWIPPKKSLKKMPLCDRTDAQTLPILAPPLYGKKTH